GARPDSRRDWEDRINPDDRAALTTAVETHLAGETEAYRADYRFRTERGDERWIRERGVVTARDASGRPTRLNGNCRDVDRPRRERDALVRSETRMRSLLRAAPALIVDLDAHGSITAANRPLPDGSPASPGRLIFDLVASEDAPLLQRRLATTLAEGTAEPVVIRLRGDTGWRWFEMHFASITVKGDPPHIVMVGHDVTRQRATEASLRESERRLMTLARCSPSLVFRADRDGRATYVNERWVELTDLPDGAWCGTGWTQAVHPEDRPRVQASWSRSVEAGVSWREEFRFQRVSGGPRWIFAQAAPLVGDGGVVEGFIGTCTDITDLKNAERARQRATQQLGLVLDALPIVSYSASHVDGRLQYLSSSARSITGFAVDRFEDDRGFWRRRVHPEDRAGLPRTLDETLPQDAEFEYRWRVADGTYRWFAHFVRVEFDADDDTPRVYGMWQDVTKRKESEVALRGSEERFRQLAEHISEVFWLSDWRTKRVLWVSPQYTQIWRRSVASLLERPSSWSENIHPDDRDRVVERFNRDAAKGRYDEQYRLQHDDGTIRWIHDRAFPIRDANGEVYRIAGLSADITARVQVEEELRRRSDVERRLFSELDHRVRNNLASLISLIDMTADTTTDRTDFAAAVRGRVQAMAAAHGLLTHSKWAAADIRDLIGALVPCGVPGRLEIEGEELLIPPHQSTAVAMVLHEMMTNSVKHGALGVKGGLARLSWGPADAAAAATELRWRERGGPLIEVKPTPGLGTSLIEGFARADLGGGAQLGYAPEGVDHRLTLRLEPAAAPAGKPPPETAFASLPER
ncbi:MAG: PAS domain-containing protein, partial [Phycisphaerae bacterium]|nr:PAS domain-containing protein [Phycisphaerae bacterium]